MNKQLVAVLLVLFALGCGDDLGWDKQGGEVDCLHDDTDADTASNADSYDSDQLDVGVDSGDDDADVAGGDLDSLEVEVSPAPDATEVADTEDVAPDIVDVVTADDIDDEDAASDSVTTDPDSPDSDDALDADANVPLPPECTQSSECDDGKLCTLDECNDKGKCEHNKALFDSLPCNTDGSVCTLEKCLDGECLDAGNAFCDDQNPCTDDLCDSEKGCEHWANIAACTDGDACTAPDVCVDKTCVVGPAIACDDQNPCTDDSCDPSKGCANLPNTASCTDSNACTANDVCGQGVCVGTEINCDDGNSCTDDFCDPKLGCKTLPNVLPCNDQNVCTLGDKCEGGVCLAESATNCDDSNPCTADQCDVVTGCASTPSNGPCTDDNACTTDDQCEQGLCMSVPLVCNDQSDCTDDSCDPAAGCVFAKLNDGTKCGAGTCSNGVCTCLTGFGCSNPKYVYSGDVNAGMLGGMGGNVGPKMGCAQTDILIGIGFDFSTNTKTVTRTTIVCGTVTVNTQGNVITTQTTTQKNGGSGCYGWDPSTPTPLTLCPNGWAIVGLKGSNPGDTLFNSVSIMCEKLGVGGAPSGITQTVPVVGTNGNGTPKTVTCPAGTIARYFETRAGCGQDALTMYCAKATPDCTGQPLICKD